MNELIYFFKTRKKANLTIVIIAAFIFLWRLNIRENMIEQEKRKEGKPLPTNKKAFSSLLDENFDKTLLALPCLGIFVFTVLPIFFMIFVLFRRSPCPFP